MTSNVWTFYRLYGRRFRWSDKWVIINERHYVSSASNTSCIVYLFYHMDSDVENNY